MSEPLTQWWRCRGCGFVGHRDGFPIRRGIIECGRCMRRSQVVGLLEPFQPLRRYAVYRVIVGKGLVDWVTELDAPSDALALEYAERTESFDPRTERLEVEELEATPNKT